VEEVEQLNERIFGLEDRLREAELQKEQLVMEVRAASLAHESSHNTHILRPATKASSSSKHEPQERASSGRGELQEARLTKRSMALPDPSSPSHELSAR
jgi:hypothetical protein